MKNEDRGELTAVSDGRRRPTNHERYLGTPELAAATTVEPQRNEDGSRWVVVWHDGAVVGAVKERYYLAWLKQEAAEGGRS